MKTTFSLFLTYLLFITQSYSQDCRPSTMESDFNPNNVNAKIWGSGNIFAFGDQYKVANVGCDFDNYPATVFASTIWFGGKTTDGNIRIAGTTYRSQTDNYDWYPGPLDANGNTYEENCRNWDKSFEVNGGEIQSIKINYDNNIFIGVDCDKIPQSIRYWPAKGNPYWNEKYGFDLPDQELATFYDYDNDGIYDPCKGDLPSLKFVSKTNEIQTPEKVINTFPSQLVFWIINDNGGPHRLSAGSKIKMELHFYAYGYKGEKDFDNTSFVQIRSLYKGELDFEDAFVGLWVDPDLGCYVDDYIGSDTTFDMMYTYNADSLDGSNGINCAGGIKTFGNNVPIQGFQFIEGLKYFNGGTMTNTGMTSAIISNNGSIGTPEPPTTDPENSDIQFYNNLMGRFRTGDVITKGGNGYNPGSVDSTKFMYPAPPNDPNGWSMCSANTPFGDRRLLMSTGNVKMKKGDINDVVIAFIYQPTSVLPCPTIKPLQILAQKMKNFHDNSYKLTIGPDSPELITEAKNNKIVLKFNNDFPASNNKDLQYSAKVDGVDSYYKFEGYKVYQHKFTCFSTNAYQDTSFSKLIYQFDLSNDVTDIHNWEDFDGKIEKTLKVNGSNNGVPDSIIIDYDFFENEALVNGNEYYYEVISYGYNNYADFDSVTGTGQRMPYIEGVGNRKIIRVVPLLKNDDEKSGVQIIRLSGEGVSRYNRLEPDYNAFDFDVNTTELDTIIYKQGYGPFTATIIDSSKIDTSIIYKIIFSGNFSTGSKECTYVDSTVTYEIVDDITGEILIPKTLINGRRDIELTEIGIKINLHLKDDADNFIDLNNVVTLKYKDENGSKWFNGLIRNPNPIKTLTEKLYDPIQENPYLPLNGILTNGLNNEKFFAFYHSKYYDNESPFPIISPAASNLHPIAIDGNSGTLKLKDLNNVDVVFTSDKSKWSRCIVVESCNTYYTQQGLSPINDIRQMQVRTDMSLGKDGKPDNSGTSGFSWFPGYAYDIEKGERLNIFFAENSCLRDESSWSDITSDMIFNPDSITLKPNLLNAKDYYFGGQHYIYVTRQKYDECQELSQYFKSWTSDFSMRFPMGAITWASVPLLTQGTSLLSVEDGIIPNDLLVKLRVTNSFSKEKYIEDISKINNCFINNEDASYLLKVGKHTYTTNVKNEIDDNDLITVRANINSFSILNLEGETQISIIGIDGKRLEYHHTNNPEFNWMADSNFQSGVYIVNISDKRGRSKSFKLIVIN